VLDLEDSQQGGRGMDGSKSPGFRGANGDFSGAKGHFAMPLP
jgi:hypothetical protein